MGRANGLNRHCTTGMIGRLGPGVGPDESAREVSEPCSTASYRPEIDGLRALAVVAVIVNHFNKGILPSGYLGVDIFFVISGFVITSSLAGRSSIRFSSFLAEFYVRRIKRLVPPLVPFVILTSVLLCLFNPGPGVSMRTGVGALFGVSNLYLLKESTDYFATAAEMNVFMHTWSLGVEEQFYLLFPPLLWWAGLGRAKSGRSTRLRWVAGALSVASLVSFVYLYEANQPAAYFSMPTRFWELATGCLLFVGMKGLGPRCRVLEAVPASVIAVALLGALFSPLHLAVPATVAVVALTAALIARLGLPNGALGVFTLKGVVYIGLVSYSLYLWHWAVLSLSHWTIGIHWWTVPFQVAAMMMLAAGSYRYVETPLRRAEWSPLRWRSIAYGAAATVFAAGVMVAVFLVRGRLYTGQRYLGPSLHEENLIKGTSVNQSNCMLSGGETFSSSSFDACHLKASHGLPTIFFVGSSHAMHLAGLGEGLHQRGFGVAFLTTQGHNFDPRAGNGLETLEFNDAQDMAIYSLLDSRAVPGSVIVIGNRYPQQAYESRSDDAYFEGLSALARWAEKRDVAVVHVLPLPEYPFHDVNQCAPQWFNDGMRNSGICLPTNSTERLLQIRDVQARSPRSVRFVHYDPVRVLCPSGISSCYPVHPVSQLPTFRNPDHLSNYGASLLVEDFVDFLQVRGLAKTGYERRAVLPVAER